MENKKTEPLEITIKIKFDSQEQLEKAVKDIEKILNLPNKGWVLNHIDEDIETEIKANIPEKGELYTFVGEDGTIDSIFEASGKCNVDKDGLCFWQGVKSVSWSGDLFKPIKVFKDVNLEFLAEQCRPSTPKEIELYKGYVCNERKMEDPKMGEVYYIPLRNFEKDLMFYPERHIYNGDNYDEMYIKLKYMCKTEEQCQELCDKLNEAIKNIHA